MHILPLTTPSNIRYLNVILFMAVYIGLGTILHLNAEAYLLLGIPLTFTFQLLVARQPIYKLWVRNADKFQFNKYGWIITCIFMIVPIYSMVELLVNEKLAIIHLGYYSAAILGAICAGFSYSKLTSRTIQQLFLCFVITGALRISWYFVPLILGKTVHHPDYLGGLRSLFIYIPIAFVVEEVVFRGMLDAYIQPYKSKLDIPSALFISCLWGLWHVPLSTDENQIWIVILRSLVISLWGIILSIFWRRSENLAVPGFSHAFADAVRDSFK